jgi:hypothetical protein
MCFRMSKLLFLLAVGAVAVFAEEGADKIRQCTCDEMDKCHQEMREKFKPCAEKCIDKLTHPDLEKEEGKKCFEMKKDHHECFKEVRQQMCAAAPGAMLSANETFQGHHGHHGHKKSHGNDVLEEQTKHHHGHHRHGFFSFIKKNFGESGKEYTKCMKQCFHEKKSGGGCTKSLGCGLKKLSKDQWKSKSETCRQSHESRREQLCDCLGKAGMKYVKLLPVYG